MDLETRAATLCRVYGAGSTEYSAFLEDVRSTTLGAMLDLPKFVPGDVKNGGASAKQRKKKKYSKRRSQETDVFRTTELSNAAFVAPPTANEGPNLKPVIAQPLASVEEEEDMEKRPSGMESEGWIRNERKGRSMVRSYTQDPRRDRSARTDVRRLRRSQSSLDASEQITMDQQVALQLQTLVREKAELIKENSRLKNENEGLKTLLEYATCEATADDGEESDYEMSKEVLRHPGIQAWHPPELQSPTSFSSYGMLGSTSSSNDDKDVPVASQASEDTYSLSNIRP